MPNTARRITHSRWGDSSSPMTNNSSTTPSSEMLAMRSGSGQPTQSGGADHRPGQEVAQYGAQLQPLGNRHRDHRGGQQHDRIAQEVVAFHAAAPDDARLCHARRRRPPATEASWPSVAAASAERAEPGAGSNPLRLRDIEQGAITRFVQLRFAREDPQQLPADRPTMAYGGRAPRRGSHSRW